MNTLTKVALGAVALAVAIQLVPIDRSNPPMASEIPAPAEVRAILERSCYDCHTTQTRWPWYGYVAPASWLLAYDVHEAREHLDLSNWNRYDAEEKAHNLEELWDEVEEGEMPLWYYLPLHPEARLSDADKQSLRIWATEGAS